MFYGGSALYDMEDLSLILIALAPTKSPRSVPDQESNPEPNLAAWRQTNSSNHTLIIITEATRNYCAEFSELGNWFIRKEKNIKVQQKQKMSNNSEKNNSVERGDGGGGQVQTRVMICKKMWSKALQNMDVMAWVRLFTPLVIERPHANTRVLTWLAMGRKQAGVESCSQLSSPCQNCRCMWQNGVVP